MAPFTRLRKRQTCYFIVLPNELFLIISKLLSLKDRLALADTCSACRSLVSDKDCCKACVRAGLSIPNGVSARAMVRLLVRPRVGMCNWSGEGGKPKEKFNFSKIWSVSSAIRNAVKVEGHPTLVTQKHLFLRETKTFKDVHLSVAPNRPEILLCKNRLYLHEYLTHPPLRELRVCIKEDEGPLHTNGDVAFLISNPKGVTLGNYWEGLYQFLYQAPFPDMPLTEEVYTEYWDFWAGRPMDPFAESDEEDSMSEESDSDSDENPYFDRDCPTNIAMLDIWCKHFCDGILFSRKALRWELSLHVGILEAIIHLTGENSILDSPYFLDMIENMVYGQPKRVWESEYMDERVMAPCEDSNREFWKENVPVIQF